MYFETQSINQSINLCVAQNHYEQSLECVRREAETDETYYGAISVTITYNLARLHELTHEHDKAERLYKDILREHPNYIDCQYQSTNQEINQILSFNQ